MLTKSSLHQKIDNLTPRDYIIAIVIFILIALISLLICIARRRYLEYKNQGNQKNKNTLELNE